VWGAHIFRAYVVCFYTPTLNKICICILFTFKYLCLFAYTIKLWRYELPTQKWATSKKVSLVTYRGGSRGRTRRSPQLKLEKIWFFGVKSWFFTRNTPTFFAPPSAIGKNMIFWRKMVFFHTKYLKIFLCKKKTLSKNISETSDVFIVIPRLFCYRFSSSINMNQVSEIRE
jgi:hypothetical protein